MTTTYALKIFRTGYTYSVTRSGNAAIVRTWKVLKRTDKTMTVLDDYGKQRRCAIKVLDGYEVAYPDGTYAWAPMISAHRHD
jgi:hypothetical protein